MRHERITAARVQPNIFSCTCCEVVEHSPFRDAPSGWAVEYIDGAAYTFCSDCKIDLPGGHMPAGATATRLGVASQLDLAGLFELDEEDRLHAERLARIAKAERIGKAVMPVLLGAIALLTAACVVSQATKWIVLA